MFDYESLLSTRFPQKLWRIVNECQSGAIRWSFNGKSILLNYKRFHKEYLNPPHSIFKTNNITSFIRQLNLYGFRKVTTHNRDLLVNTRNPDVHEFLHSYFHRDRIDLLSKVCRKTSINQTKYLIKNELIKNNNGMSRLQLCQIALKQALEQAAQEYRRKKLHEKTIDYINDTKEGQYKY